jgi:hypothetical protein
VAQVANLEAIVYKEADSTYWDLNSGPFFPSECERQDPGFSRIVTAGASAAGRFHDEMWPSDRLIVRQLLLPLLDLRASCLICSRCGRANDCFFYAAFDMISVRW